MILTHGANSLTRGGPIGNLFHYKTNFKNFDIATLTDNPLEGNPITFTGSGSLDLSNDAEGLLFNNSGSFSFVRNATDFFNAADAKRIVFKSKWKILDATLDSWQWAWDGINNTLNNFGSRGQGMWMVSQNLVTNYTIPFTETHDDVPESMAVPIPANIFLNEEVEAVTEWNVDGSMSYKYRGEDAGSNTGVSNSNIVYRLCGMGFGTNYVKFVLTGMELDVFG
jgi:hypothetical protein